MTTLRDLWLAKEWSLEDVIAHMRIDVKHPISRPTLYKLVHHDGQEGEVKLKTVRAVCQLFGITLNDFEELQPYRPANRPKDKKE